MSVSKFNFIDSNVEPKADKVLSSTQLHTLVLSRKDIRSFMKILKRIGPNIDP